MTERCPLKRIGGLDCPNEPSGRSWFDICDEHWEAIVEDHKRAAQDTANGPVLGCPVCRHKAIIGPGPFMCSNPNCWEDRWWEQPDPEADVPARAGTHWIYYLRFGDRIKIGTSMSVKRRLSTLPYDEVLALEPGSYDLERQRHTQFAADLIPGQREWFTLSVPLFAHIDRIRIDHGTPAEILGRA